jgi:PAS domain S-box-containing protein
MIPPMASAGKENSKNIEALIKKMEAFNEVAEQLQRSYDELQVRIKKLDLELEDKNKELEKNLVEKEEVKNYLNDILESLTNGVIVVDRSGRITTFNQTAGHLTGLKPQNCLGKTLKEVFPFDLFENLVSRLEKNRRETAYQDQDITTPDKKIIHARVSASPVWDNHSGQIGTVLILQDRTDLRRLEEFAHRNQRLREMGEMAAGIAHEIRNPLGSIELFASLLKKDLEGDLEKAELVQHIRAGVQNMDRIISTLLLFAKSSQPSRQQCDINLLLAELLDGLDDIRVPDNIKVVRDFGKEEMLANGDRELLRQVFPNLIRNAIQAMPDGGELRLQTEKALIPVSGSESGKDAGARKFITVTVTDTGGGICADDLSKIFNPFFTTKDKGTGLGLAISHNIIKAHQGTIEAVSEEGKSTSFRVKIPCWDEDFDEK